MLLIATDLVGATNYKKWLDEEVVWIISQKEKESFRRLKSDSEREEFVRTFWERRDPTPNTPYNEFKEEHYRRYQHALKSFQEGTAGWKTDRGRIYIIHGAPDREYFHVSDSRLKFDSKADNRSRIPNTIVWSYRQNPNGKYYRGELNLIFQPSAGLSRQSFTLGESKTAQDKAEQMNRQFGPATDQTWLESDVRYRLIVAGPPAIVNPRGAEVPTAGLGEATRYLEDLFRSPGDVLEENLERSAERDKAKEQLRQAVVANVSFGALPLSLSTSSFLRPDGKYRLQVELNLSRAELQALIEAEPSPRVDFYCALLDAEGRVVDEFIDSIEVDRSTSKVGAADGVRYMNAFTTVPGRFRLKAAMRNPSLKVVGYNEAVVELHDRSRQGLGLSDLFLTNRFEPVGEKSAVPDGVGLVYGDTRLLPSASREFLQSDKLLVYLQVLLPEGKTAEEFELSGAVSFIAGDAIAKRLDARRIESGQSPDLLHFATVVPLDTFSSGTYVLQVQVIDHVSKKFLMKRSPFTVVPAK
jgi:GWxTD domain-containing protein